MLGKTFYFTKDSSGHFELVLVSTLFIRELYFLETRISSKTSARIFRFVRGTDLTSINLLPWKWSRDCRFQSQEPTKTIPPLSTITKMRVTIKMITLLPFTWDMPFPWRLSLMVWQRPGSRHFTVHSLVGSFSKHKLIWLLVFLFQLISGTVLVILIISVVVKSLLLRTYMCLALYILHQPNIPRPFYDLVWKKIYFHAIFFITVF